MYPRVEASFADSRCCDQTDHDLVAHEATGVHHLLGHHAELGAFAGGGAQHVTGRDVRYDEVP